MNASKAYVMHSDGRAKIGVSDIPKKELSQLQVGNPSPLFLYYTLHVNCEIFASVLESFVHKRLSDRWLKDGWFDVSPERAVIEVANMAIAIDDFRQHHLRLPISMNEIKNRRFTSENHGKDFAAKRYG